jgi:hypothetical protein
LNAEGSLSNESLSLEGYPASFPAGGFGSVKLAVGSLSQRSTTFAKRHALSGNP